MNFIILKLLELLKLLKLLELLRIRIFVYKWWKIATYSSLLIHQLYLFLNCFIYLFSIQLIGFQLKKLTKTNRKKNIISKNHFFKN